MSSKPITSFFAASTTKRAAESDASAASASQPLSSSPKKKAKASAEEGEAEAGSWASMMEEMHPSWKVRLESEIKKPYMERLVSFLVTESKSHAVYPPREQVWTALNLTPFDKVKVIVIGQDPYHGPNQAHGLAFSVAKGIAIPPSLRNMIAEASRDPGTAIPAKAPHGNLECWSKQGVLMLNTCLTVRKGEANSHQKKGWEEFTDAIVRELGKRQGLVYLLWGSPAQAKCKAIDVKKNRVIKSSHPSPLAAYKTSEPFMGSNCFSKCNEALQELGHSPIDWHIV